MSGPATEIRVAVPGAGPREYPVRLEAGGLERLGTFALETAPAHRYALIADSRVAELYGERALGSLAAAGADADLATFPAGEWNKTREEWSRLSDRLLAAGHGRDSCVVALGGGVTGDLAGFVAATFMRGIPVVQVPSSLLAMVDSSVGGKTGVDTDAGKNMVGSFHHPRGVLIDPDLLATLPVPQRASGLAEVVKTAAILDADFFDWLEERAPDLLAGDLGDLAEAVLRTVRHKAEVVASDPAEGGLRAVLNFGHTVGHALELLGGYALLHGEAVAAGMRVEARLGEDRRITEPGTASRLAALLDACGLDRRVEEDRRPAAVWEAAARDKKARAGAVRCVLLRRIGQVATGADGGFTHELPGDRGEGWLAAVLRPGEDG